MNFITFGEKFYPGFAMSVAASKDVEAFNNVEENDSYKMLFLKSGNAKITINEKEFIVFGPKVICLNEIDQHSLSSDHDEIEILYFRPSVLNSKYTFEACNTLRGLTVTEHQDLFYFNRFKHNVKDHEKMISINSFEAIKLSEKITNLNELLTSQADSYWPCKSRATLLEILFLVIGATENSIVDNIEVDTSYSELTKDVIYYLQTMYDKKLTINKIVSDLHTNRTTLLSDFKKSTGISYSKYLTQLRIKISASMLADTLLTINEICDRTGFSDVSYFCKTFKKETKLTPSEFRQRNNTLLTM